MAAQGRHELLIAMAKTTMTMLEYYRTMLLTR